MNIDRPDGDRTSDSEVDRAWRSVSTELPPPNLDAAILSAAKSRRLRLGAWQPMAAVATVAALAFLLLQLMPRERHVEAPISIESAQVAPPDSGASEQAKAVAERVTPSTAPATQEVPASERVQAARQSASSVDAAVQLDEKEARDATAVLEVPSPAAAISAEATAGNSMRAAPEIVRELSPEQWVARIESLYRSGDVDAAASELREFRVAYADADHHLPNDLRDWASGIK